MTNKYKKKTKKKIGGMTYLQANNMISSITAMAVAAASRGEKGQEIKYIEKDVQENAGTLTPEEVIKIKCEERKTLKKKPATEKSEKEEKILQYDDTLEETNNKAFNLTKIAQNLNFTLLLKVVAKISAMQLAKSTQNVNLLTTTFSCPSFIFNRYGLFISQLDDSVIQNFKDACKCIYLLYNYKFCISYGYLFDKPFTPSLFCVHMHYIQKQYNLNNVKHNKSASDIKKVFNTIDSNIFTNLYKEVVEKFKNIDVTAKPSMLARASQGLTSLATGGISGLKAQATAKATGAIADAKAKATGAIADAKAKATGAIAGAKAKATGAIAGAKAKATAATAATKKITTPPPTGNREVKEQAGGSNKTKKYKGGASILSGLSKATESKGPVAQFIDDNRKYIEKQFVIKNLITNKNINYSYIILNLLYDMHHFKVSNKDNIFYKIMIELITDLKIDSHDKISMIPYSTPKNEEIGCMAQSTKVNLLNLII